ncbi:hypothetical protein N4282_10565, partial [Staphylococcus aureus]|nr:hypothetical protein [Staphylococcus aureus]
STIGGAYQFLIGTFIIILVILGFKIMK